MTAHAHTVIGLLQISFTGVQIRLKTEAGLAFVAGGTLDAFGIFLQLALIHDVFPTFEPVMAAIALDLSIYVLNVGNALINVHK